MSQQQFTVYVSDRDVKRMLVSNSTIGKPPLDVQVVIDEPSSPEHGAQLLLRVTNVRVPRGGDRDFDAEVLSVITPGQSGISAFSVGMKMTGHVITRGVGFIARHIASLAVK